MVTGSGDLTWVVCPANYQLASSMALKTPGPLTPALLAAASSSTTYGGGEDDYVSLYPLEAAPGQTPEWSQPTQSWRFSDYQKETVFGEPIVNGKITAPCYARIVQQPDYYAISYYFLCGFNGEMGLTTQWDAEPLSEGFYAHVGDWMRVSARVTVNADGTVNLLGVEFEAHGNVTVRTDSPFAFSNQTLDDIKPITAYAAWHSHEMFPTAGKFPSVDHPGLSNDFTDDDGIHWDTRKNLVMLYSDQIQPGQEWITYNGLWGANLSIGTPLTAGALKWLKNGPQGPAFHSDWVRGTQYRAPTSARPWHLGRANHAQPWPTAWDDMERLASNSPGRLRALDSAMVDGTLHVVALPFDTAHVQHLTRGWDGQWSAWGDVDEQMQQALGSAPTALACATTAFDVQPQQSASGDVPTPPPPSSALNLLAVGADGAIHLAIRNPDGSWTGWTSVAPANGAWSGAWTDIACTTLSDGLHILGIDGQGALWHATWSAQSTLSAWERVPIDGLHNTGAQPGPLGRIAVNGHWGNLMVVATTVSGRVICSYRNWTPSWAPIWTDVATAPNQSPTQGQYSEVAIARAGTLCELVVLRADGQVLYAEGDGGEGGYGGLGPLYPPMSSDPAPFSQVTAAGVGESRELHVVAVSTS